jgi:biopolymer transport protein ExbD
MKFGSPLPHKKARIEIIPLIDIMFFLLASFMLASLSMMRLQSVRDIDLPSAQTATNVFKPDIVNISVDKQGDVYIDKNQVDLATLHSYLSNKFRINTNVPVYISADKETYNGMIMGVLNAVRLEGIQKVSFALFPPGSAPKEQP